MQGKLQITFRDMPPSEALEARIREKVAKLEQFHPNITSCRVTVEEAHRHQQLIAINLLERSGASLDFSNRDEGGADAYERLIGDAMLGDATLFSREDGVEAAWRVVDPILSMATPVSVYGDAGWGPSEADRMVEPFGGWHNPAARP